MITGKLKDYIWIKKLKLTHVLKKTIGTEDSSKAIYV